MRATAIAHPNVALIKYWGKEDTGTNLPAVGSLSLTMGGLETRTTVEFSPELDADELSINGVADPIALERVTRCLDLLRVRAGTELRARVESGNDFPTGAGLASSASGYAALVRAATAALGLSLEHEVEDYIARLEEFGKLTGDPCWEAHSLLQQLAGDGKPLASLN